MLINCTYKLPSGKWQTVFTVQSAEDMFNLLKGRDHKVMITSTDLPELIKECREYMQLTQSQLAEKTGSGYTKQVISAIENGRQKIGAELIKRFAIIFDLSLYVNF